MTKEVRGTPVLRDEELIAYLRLQGLDKDIAAADRIEALIEESSRRLALARSEGVARVEQFERNEALTKELNTCRMAQAVMDNTVADLEAKLSKTEGLLAENEVRLRKAVEAFSAVLRYVPDSVVECRGDKCREPWCASCWGWDDAEKAIAVAYETGKQARATLAEIKSHSDEFATQKGESHE